MDNEYRNGSDLDGQLGENAQAGDNVQSIENAENAENVENAEDIEEVTEDAADEADEPKGQLLDVDLNKEMRKSFLDYSMSVIMQRALPTYSTRCLKITSPRRASTASAPIRSVPFSDGIIPTATRRFTTQWYVWRSLSR